MLRTYLRILVTCLLWIGLATALAEEIQFALRVASVTNDSLVLVIDSNLPDEAEVRVSAYRIYTRVGVPEQYSRAHFLEDGSLGQWREPRRMSVDPEMWKAELLSFQRDQARASKEWAFEIDEIADEIEVSASVFANKTGERYGRREYDSLIARIQNTEGLASSELVVHLPLVTAEPIPRQSSFVAFDALEFGGSYRLLGDQIPLLSQLPPGGWEDLQYLHLPAGTVIRVEAIVLQDGDYWYLVTLLDHPSYSGLEGWINSIALIREGVERVSMLE